MSRTTNRRFPTPSLNWDGAGWRDSWPGALLIVAITLLAYSSVFPAGFIWDDNDHVIRIGEFLSLRGLARIWFEPGVTIQYYPLVFSLFWLQLKLWGVAPFGFHLVNIVLHGVNAVLVQRCLTRLAIPGAFLAACLFAIHPVHVESVAWVTELKNVLSALFYLVALLRYLEFLQSDRESADGRRRARLSYAGALVLFCCALLSKTVTCTLPAVILLIVWWKRGAIGRRDVVPLVPFFAAAVVLGVITLGVERDSLLAKGPEWDFSPVERFLIAGRVTWFHAGKLLWPHPLTFNYPRWNLDATVWWQYLFPVSAITLLLLLWHYRGKVGRAPLAASLFVMGTNFPVLGFLNVYSMRFSFVADHYYYLANIGVIAVAASVATLLRHRLPQRGQAVVSGIVAAVLLVLATITWQHGTVFRDDLTLFGDIIAKNPGSWFAYTNRAAQYMNTGRYDPAMADLEQALRFRPDDADALRLQGEIYARQRDFSRALANFDRSIALRPWRGDYFKSRSKARLAAGRLSEALEDVTTVLTAASHDADNYLLRANIYLALNDLPAALADLDRVLSLEGDNADGWANRGLVRYRQQRIPEAIADLDRALQLNPSSAGTWFNRGLAHAAAGQVEPARADLFRARDMGYGIDEMEIREILAHGKQSGGAK